MGTLLMMMGWLLSDMPPAAVDVARQLYVEATQSYQAGDWAGGVERLERAYVLVRKPAILFNIAFGYGHLEGKCGDALATYERYFAACASQPCPDLVAARANDGRIRAVCAGHVALETDPMRAEIWVDRKAAGVSPVTLELSPGKHVLEARRADFLPQVTTVEIEPGKTQTVRLTLPAAPPKPPPGPPPSAAVPTNPTAVAAVDAPLLGTTPARSRVGRPWAWAEPGRSSAASSRP